MLARLYSNKENKVMGRGGILQLMQLMQRLTRTWRREQVHNAQYPHQSVLWKQILFLSALMLWQQEHL